MLNPLYEACIQACSNCAIVCEACSASCLREDNVKMMAYCIVLERDCVDLCGLAATLMARNSRLSREMCRICAEACRACAEECTKHPMEHCQACAKACRECAEVCEKMAA